MSAALKLVSTGKVCIDCKLGLPTSDFPTSGYAGRCKSCKNALKREQRRLRCKNVPGYREKLSGYAKAYQATAHGTKKIREYHVRRKYGVEYADVLAALGRQHGLCANRACGSAISLSAPKAAKNQAVIDHDHRTGKFRAILCFPCNMKLGHLEADKNITLGLLEYADKHSEK